MLGSFRRVPTGRHQNRVTLLKRHQAGGSFLMQAVYKIWEDGNQKVPSGTHPPLLVDDATRGDFPGL